MSRLSFKEWCVQNNRNGLLDEWDFDKNALLGYYPDKIGCKSSKYRVWWRCPIGHSYDAYVGNRTRRDDDCPFCSNHRLLKGFNDLAHVAPKLVDEWDYKKNTEKHDTELLKGIKNPHPASPDDILYGSNHKVFWICKNGHQSYLSPNERKVKRDGTFTSCDKCTNLVRAETRRITLAKKSNLADLVPQAVKEWVYSEHNLQPSEVSCASTELVHWKCKKGHEFNKRVCERVFFASGRYALHQCAECTKYQRTSIVEQICYFYIKQVFPDAINTYKTEGAEFDIFIPSIMTALEYDGSFAHKNRLIRENKKDAFALEKGITLYRFRSSSLPDTASAHRITIEETILGTINGLYEFFSSIGVCSPKIDFEKDYNKIMLLFEMRTGESILDTPFIKEWDYEKNEINPKYVMAKESHIKIWWKCPNGHPSYLSYPYNRTVRHTGCKICSNKNAVRKRKKVRNTETGEVFNSIKEAEMMYGKPGNTSISLCCKGRYKTAYGYHWEYVMED